MYNVLGCYLFIWKKKKTAHDWRLSEPITATEANAALSPAQEIGKRNIALVWINVRGQSGWVRG